MAKQSRNTLKGYFETGKRPTEGQYADLIDSQLLLSGENTGSINLLGDTSLDGNLTNSGNLTVTGSATFGTGTVVINGTAGHITASGNINVSGNGIFAQIDTGQGLTEVHLMNQNIRTIDGVEFSTISSTSNTTLGNSADDTHTFTGNITASGNISASGNIIATFITASETVKANAFVGDGSGLTNITSTNIITNVTAVTASIATGSLYITGSVNYTSGSTQVLLGIETSGSILPNKDGEVDLGSPTKYWKDLYVSESHANKFIGTFVGAVSSSSLTSLAQGVAIPVINGVNGTPTALGLETTSNVKFANITSSGNISGSNTITGLLGSFRTLKVATGADITGSLHLTGSTSDLRVDGTVGIGVASPTATNVMMHIKSNHVSADPTVIIEGGGGSDDATIQLKNADVNWSLSNQGGGYSDSFLIRDTSTALYPFAIDPTAGGIGTAPLLYMKGDKISILRGISPTANLHVSGNILADGPNGNILASGNISASGTLIANEANIIGHITASGNISASNISATHIIGGHTTFYKASNDTGSQAGITVHNSSTGDSVVQFLNSNDRWLLGIDNDDADKFKIAGGVGASGLTGLHANNHLVIATDGATQIYGNLTASGNISASGIITGEGLVISDDANITDILTAGTITTSHITASGNIEATSYISASEFRTTGHITSSGQISASGTGDHYLGGVLNLFSANPGDRRIRFGNSSDSNQTIQASPNYMYIDADDQLIVRADNQFIVSSSKTGIGSFDVNITPSAVLHVSGTTATDTTFLVEGSDGIDYLTVGVGGHISASGNISASGTIISNIITPTTITNVNTTHITASGNISASGNIIATGDITASNLSVSGTITSNVMTPTTITNVSTIHITASGNISASGNVINTGNITSDGTGSFVGGIDLQDNQKLVLGTGNDLSIYHTGAHSYIVDSGTGDLKIFGANIELGNVSGVLNFKGISGGASNVYHNGNEKLATTANGINVTGEITASGNISASGNIIASGTGSFEYGHFIHDVSIGVPLNASTAALHVRDITPDKHTAILIDSTGADNMDVSLLLSSSAQTWVMKQYAQGAVGTGQYELQIGDVTNSSVPVRIAKGQSSNTLVLSGSNVGIGQLNPGEKLTVAGNISSSGNLITTHVTASGNISASSTIQGLTGSFNRIEMFGAGTNEGFYFDNDGSESRIEAVANDLVLQTIRGNDDIELKTSSSAGGPTTKMFISSSGNVGIGTSTPGEKLEVQGNISSSGNITATGTGSFGGGIDLEDNQRINVGTGVDLTIYRDATDTYITNSGSGELRIESDDLRLRSHNASETYITAEKDGAVKLYYNNVERFATNQSGSEASGSFTVTHPSSSAILNVQGDITASGNIKIVPREGGYDGGNTGNLEITGGIIDLKNSGLASKILFYCEDNNAHAQTIQAAPHSDGASNVLVLPSTGTKFATQDGTETFSGIKTFTLPITASSHISAGGNISATGTLTAGASTVTTLNASSHITASGNISSSGNITATGTGHFGSHITSSGNISASGTITSNVMTPTTITNVSTIHITASGNISGSSTSTLSLGGAATIGGALIAGASTVTTLNASSHITASGNISASGNITATGDITASNLTGNNTGDQSLVHLAVTGSNVLFANITASGNISSSGTIVSTGGFTGTLTGTSTNIAGTPSIAVTHVTASNISASGTITSTGGFTGTLTGTATGLSGTPSIVVTNITSSNISASNSIFGEINLDDNNKIKLGTGDDLEIYHNGTNSVISEVGTGDLSVQSNGAKVSIYDSANSNFMGKFNTGGSVELLYNGSTKFATTAGGVNIIGNVTASGAISASGNLSATGDLDIDGNTSLGGHITASGNISSSGTVRALTGSFDMIQGHGFKIDAVDGANSVIEANINDLVLQTIRTIDDIKLNTSSSAGGPTTKMFISASGNVGIGNSAPTEKLTVHGNISASGAINTLSHITSSGNISSSRTIQGLTGSFTEGRFTGNVGIGTTTPGRKLEVAGSDNLAFFNSTGNAYITIDRSAADRRSGLVFSTGGDGTSAIPDNINWALGTADSDEVTPGVGFYIGQSTNANNSNFFISSSGDVGINTRTPKEKLTVHGNISASGNYIGVSSSLDYLTTTGNISASGNIISDNLTVIATGSFEYIAVDHSISASGTVYGNTGIFNTLTNVNTTHVTASGNISSSGTIKALTLEGRSNVTGSTNVGALSVGLTEAVYPGGTIIGVDMDTNTHDVQYTLPSASLHPGLKYTFLINSNAGTGATFTLSANTDDAGDLAGTAVCKDGSQYILGTSFLNPSASKGDRIETMTDGVIWHVTAFCSASTSQVSSS